jgi:hypothetical protein
VTSAEIEFLGPPAGLDETAEYPHPPPGPPEPALWGDTMWVGAFDPEAGVRGINHIYLTNRGFGRFQSHFWIDGVKQVHGCRAPVVLDPTLTSWSDGRLTYEVVEPFERIRMTMDHPQFGFDLMYSARFPAFDYDDCADGNPLWVLEPVAPHHGGHFEQALMCEGTFEIRGGPNAGETREINCLAHRDRTWSDRFAGERPWEDPPGPDAGLHFWLIMCFPERDIHGFGFFDPAAHGLADRGNGRRGAIMSARGSRRVIDVSPVPEYDGDAAAWRETHGPHRWRFALEGGEALHVRVTDYHDRVKLWLRGENDLENTLDDFEDMVDLEVEETGERGYGAIEYSILPARPRWVA